MNTSSRKFARLRRGLETARLLIGDIGIRVLLLLGLAIHLSTIWIAYYANEGIRAWVVAAISAVVPAVPELYWAWHVYTRAGTLMDPYVLAIIGYPIACALFLLGGWFFFPERAASRINATETD